MATTTYACGKHPLRLLHLLVGCTLAAALATCATEGGQTGEEFPVPCIETREPIGPDVAPPEVGFSAADVLAALTGTSSAPFIWADGEETEVAVTVSGVAGEATHVVLTRDPDFGDFGECPDALEVPVTVDFVTADGALEERVETTLRAFELTEALLLWRRPAAGLARVAPLVPAGVAEPRLTFGGEVRSGSSMGTVTGDDAAREASEPFEVGRWGASVTEP